nr:unnamed protein product [Timema tahoe]
MANKSSEGLPLKHVLSKLHAFASPALAESWDNVGLLVEPVTPRPIANILLTNDLTEAVMQEALELSTDLIISYHPPIFVPLKSVTTKTWKVVTHVNLDQVMLEWFSQHRVKNVPINEPMMQRKADEFSLRAMRPAVITNCFRHAYFVLPVNEETAVYVLPTAASAEDPDDPPPVDTNSKPGPYTEQQPGLSTAPSSAPPDFHLAVRRGTVAEISPRLHERLIATCLENRVALYSPHTSWDVVKDGVNDWLARAFDNEKVTPLMPHINLDPNSSLRVDVSVPSTLNRVSILQALHDRTTQADRELVHYNVLPSSENMVSLTCSESFKHLLSDMFPKTSHGSSGDLIGVSKYEGIPVSGHGTGRLCVLKKPISILEAVERVKKHIGIPYVRLALASDKDQDALISTVALCPGSGTSVLKGVKADLWLTGEMFHHDVLDAVHKGTHVILCNHSDSERGFLTSFADTLAKLLDSKVSVKLSLSDCDPLKTV